MTGKESQFAGGQPQHSKNPEDQMELFEENNIEDVDFLAEPHTSEERAELARTIEYKIKNMIPPNRLEIQFERWSKKYKQTLQ